MGQSGEKKSKSFETTRNSAFETRSRALQSPAANRLRRCSGTERSLFTGLSRVGNKQHPCREIYRAGLVPAQFVSEAVTKRTALDPAAKRVLVENRNHLFRLQRQKQQQLQAPSGA